MSQVKNNPSYSNSLSSLHQSAVKTLPSEPLILLKDKKKSTFYSFMCCFCVPNNTITKKIANKSSFVKVKTESNDIITHYNNTSVYGENSKIDENISKSTNFIKTMKTKSNFAINEIMTPTEQKSKRNRQFNLRNSQFLKKNRSEENLAKIILSTFPKNQLYFLKFGDKYLLGRNLHWHFKNPHNFSQNFSICSEEKSHQTDVFSLKKKCFKFDSESIIVSDPEYVSRRLAKKLKNYQTIVEFGCGVGNLTINLAKKCGLVYGIDHHHNKLSYAEYNVKMSGMRDKVILTEGNSLRHVKVKPDLIFLNPEWEMKNKFLMESHLVSFQNMSPDIFSLMEDSFKLCQNIVIVLPKCININEFAYILSKMEEKNLIKGDKYSMEFEYIHINNKLWKIYAFIGLPNTITHHEEIEFVSSHLNEDIDCDVLFKENTTLLKQIDSRLGMRTIMKILPEILSKENGHNKTLTFFQKFLDDLKYKNLLSNCEMSELLVWKPLEKTKKNMHQRANFKEVNTNVSRNQSSLTLLKKSESKQMVYQEDPDYCQSEYSSASYSQNDSENDNNRESLIRKKNYKSFKMDGIPHASRQKARISFS